MKNILSLSIFCAALFSTAPVYAVEVSADASQTIHEYNGHARAVFKPKEEFRISSDKTSRNNDITVFSGNVVVTFDNGTLKADSITVKKQADGGSLLEARKFSLEHVGVK